ncbi:hypothetical protein ACD578_28845 (plasmid) [Microvirga sp. RSM25]|uniref:hypothetical protein n=1 Tax=Microvirga sp. RSM25 TaxID=3273802 RepID=UPI00384FF2AD
MNGRKVGKRSQGNHLGEMATIPPAHKRLASVLAAEDGVAAFLSEPDFADLASRHPEMYRTIAQVLARRLMQRNALIGA